MVHGRHNLTSYLKTAFANASWHQTIARVPNLLAPARPSVCEVTLQLDSSQFINYLEKLYGGGNPCGKNERQGRNRLKR
eukprot:2078841-Amphidinium_carterae.1